MPHLVLSTYGFITFLISIHREKCQCQGRGWIRQDASGGPGPRAPLPPKSLFFTSAHPPRRAWERVVYKIWKKRQLVDQLLATKPINGAQHGELAGLVIAHEDWLWNDNRKLRTHLVTVPRCWGEEGGFQSVLTGNESSTLNEDWPWEVSAVKVSGSNEAKASQAVVPGSIPTMSPLNCKYSTLLFILVRHNLTLKADLLKEKRAKMSESCNWKFSQQIPIISYLYKPFCCFQVPKTVKTIRN